MGADTTIDWTEGSGIRPFLSWAGSKRRLLKQLAPHIPKTWNTYFEPFLGGGSMFFHLAPSSAVISDASSALIATYKAIKQDHESVAEFLAPLRPSRTRFDIIKRLEATTESDKAAQFIFLNKSCWNGLYRVNSDGAFNVPYGRPKSNFLLNSDNLELCAKQLRRQRVSIKRQDFEKIDTDVKAGDFVFFDPPYVTSHNMNGFVDWNEELFSWKDQVRLAALAKRLVKRRANVLITNADHDDVKALFSDLSYTQIVRTSTLASDKTKRRKTSEAVFFGGPAYSDEGIVKEGKTSHDSKRRAAGPG